MAFLIWRACMAPPRCSLLRALTFVSSAAFAMMATGCVAGDALIDGLYAGVSDTVAAIVSGVLLGSAAP